MVSKIYDKVTVRSHAMDLATDVSLAILKSNNKYDVNTHFKLAEQIAAYIVGSADIPEFMDSSNQAKEWVKTILEMQDLNKQ